MSKHLIKFLSYFVVSQVVGIIAGSIVGISCAMSLFCSVVQAQSYDVNRKYLFKEDRDRKASGSDPQQQMMQQHEKQIKAMDGKSPFDVSAPILKVENNGDTVIGEGGILVTYGNVSAEAERAIVEKSKDTAELSGRVRFTDLSGTVLADWAKMNFKTKDGKLKNAYIDLGAGQFRLKAEEAERISENVYKLKNTNLTTCACASKSDLCPWSIQADETEIERNGFGEVWGATFRLLEVPIFYTPYMAFPANSSRTTGLLPATLGQGRRAGFQYEQPFFWAIDNASDATFRTIYASNIRYGLDTEYRQLFSERSKMQAGFVYYDETQRNGALLGTNIAGLSDPSLDKDRFGGYLNQNWKSSSENNPIDMVIRGKYVSDDLLTREYNNSQLANYNTRFVTSKAAVRGRISDSWSTELSGEYNQSLISDDDFVLQRLPQLSVGALKTFNAFGENDLGAKVVNNIRLTGTSFSRTASYDGNRASLLESVKVPFHFQNYFDAVVETNVKADEYALSETSIQSKNDKKELVTDGSLPSSSDRVLPSLNATIGSTFEKVYGAGESGWLKTLGELGTLGRSQELVRFKHTLEPMLRYKLVAKVDQKDNPQFDANDRLPRRNVGTYELTQRIYGRYESRNPYLYGFEELTPTAENVGNLGSTDRFDASLPMFGIAEDNQFIRLRNGNVNELVRFRLAQSVNLDTNLKDDGLTTTPIGTNPRRFSDITADGMLFPNEYLGLRGKVDYNQDVQEFDSYLLEGQLSTKRGDLINQRIRFINGAQRQLDTTAEFGITDLTKIGYFGRYDDLTGKFIESNLGLRFKSSCNCWIFDINFSDRINPNDTKVFVNLTLTGLGEVTQRFFHDNTPTQ